MTWKVKDLIAELSKHDPEAEVLVGTGYDGDTELSDSFGVSAAAVNNIERNFFMEVEDDGDQEKNVVAIW